MAREISWAFTSVFRKIPRLPNRCLILTKIRWDVGFVNWRGDWGLVGNTLHNLVFPLLECDLPSLPLGVTLLHSREVWSVDFKKTKYPHPEALQGNAACALLNEIAHILFHLLFPSWFSNIWAVWITLHGYSWHNRHTHPRAGLL